MTGLTLQTRFRDIAPGYDALLCDAWGVIHNGVSLFPGAAEAMMRFRETCGPVVILTNAPRPSSIIPGQLDRLGLPRDAYDAVVTSGDATRAEIEARLPAPAYRIGPEKDDPLFDGLYPDFVSEEEAEFIVCTGLVDDHRETPDDYRDLLQRLAARGLVMICANPDIIVNWGGRRLWCAGALAEIYKEFGGTVVYGGKPHPPVYRLALEVIGEMRGAGRPPPRALAVGDGLHTDIIGANRQNIDAVFIAGAGGVHDGDADASAVAERLAAAGARAVALMEALQW